jgi:hypothetical protein
MKNTIDVKWDLLGAQLANLTDEEQGLFFKGFALELNNYESRYMAGIQICAIRSKLKSNEQAILKDLLPLLWEE